MQTILKVGYQSFLVKDNKQAAKAIEALAGMVALDSRYIGGDHKEVFWPKDHDSKIGFETVRNEQILAHDPKEDIEVVAQPNSSTRKLLFKPGH